MKVLIAADDSAHSERAVRFVSRIRWPAGSRVIVATVMPPPARTASAGQDDSVREKALARRRSHHEGVARHAQGKLRAAGLSTETRILEGDAREQLIQLVDNERIDLLVVGSRGHRGLLRLLLGSVSAHVVSHAHCSILVVRQATHKHGPGSGA